MNLIQKHLNIGNEKFFQIFGDESNIENLKLYQLFCKDYISDPDKIRNYINLKTKNFIDESFEKILLSEERQISQGSSYDLNYFINWMNTFIKILFNNVVSSLDIKHLISRIDYGKNTSSNSYFQKEYYKYFMNKFLNNEVMAKENTYPDKFSLKLIRTKSFHDILSDNWKDVNFTSIIEICEILNKLKYYEQDVSSFMNLIINKFDDIEYIKKLLDYIIKKFIEEDLQISNEENEKYNFRFLVDNLKCNGYLLYEEYYKNIKLRYKQQINIDTLKKDINIVKYFMLIISCKDNNMVNRQVNEMLITTRDYLYDLEDSYNNNTAYRKITVEAKTDKYKNINPTINIKREITHFRIFKYNNSTNEIINNFKISNKVEIFMDVYRSYYKSRYPDRFIEFDILTSTIISKMKFNEKIYYVHMALIQFMVLEKIFASDKQIGITALEISEQINIKLNLLTDTFNSLLKIKLVKRVISDDITPENIHFCINYDFEYEKNKISISNLVLKEINNVEKVKEFLHDRNIIILCNIVDYIKKNKFFTEDVLSDYLVYKIPFKFTSEALQTVIEDAIKKEFILKEDMGNDVIYKYIEP